MGKKLISAISIIIVCLSCLTAAAEPPAARFRTPTPEEVDSVLSNLPEKERLLLIVKLMNAMVQGISSRDNATVAFFLSIQGVLKKHLSTMEQGMTQRRAAANFPQVQQGVTPLPQVQQGVTQPPQPGSPQHFDAVLTNTPEPRRQQLIMEYWNTVIQAALSRNEPLMRHLAMLEPVIRKHDAAFDKHSAQVVNFVRTKRNQMQPGPDQAARARAMEAELAAIYRKAMQIPPGLSMQQFMSNFINRPAPVGGMSFGGSPMPSSGGGVCSHCGGSGLDPTRIRWAGYYGGAVRREYCRICNSTTELHSHYPCGMCRGLKPIP